MSRFSFLQPARCRVLLHQSQSASWVGWLCPGCCKVPSHWEKWEVPKGQCPTYYEGKCLIRLMWILHKPSVHTGWGGSNVGQHGFTSPIPNLSSLAGCTQGNFLESIRSCSIKDWLSSSGYGSWAPLRSLIPVSGSTALWHEKNIAGAQLSHTGMGAMLAFLKYHPISSIARKSRGNLFLSQIQFKIKEKKKKKHNLQMP